MAESLAALPNPIPATPAAPPPAPVAAPPEPAPPPQPDLIAEAEQYALAHRKRAVLIRRFGHVPHRLDFGPLRPELVQTIATATTPILTALEEKPRRLAAAA